MFMEVETLRQQLMNYEDDKRSFSATKARLSSAMKDIKNLEWENEVSLNICPLSRSNPYR